MNNHDKKTVFITKNLRGKLLGNEKSSYLASLAEVQDPPLEELPKLNHVPADHILVVVVYNEGKYSNPGYESALVCDNQYDWNRVNKAIREGYEDRPIHIFIIKREWVEKMANRPLQSGG